MLTENWTLMNRDVQKFNSLVQETLVMSGENYEDWLTRVQILFKTHTGSEFKHKSAWLFLKDKHKWKNPESTLARRNCLWVTDEEPGHFGEDALPRPPGAQRIAKSQHSSNSTASSGSNPTVFQEMMKQQYKLDRKAKIEVIEPEANSRINVYNSQKIFEDMRVLQIDTRRNSGAIGVFADVAALFDYNTRSMARGKKLIEERKGAAMIEGKLKKKIKIVFSDDV
ncbi:hypothetical protein Tco_0582905 [Tanacetum coccineum]